MNPVLLLVLALIPMLGGCGREPQKVPARNGWDVADYPPAGSLRVGLFAIERASLVPLRGSWKDFHPKLIIEPRDAVVPGAVRIKSVAFYVNGSVGPSITLEVSFDDGPPEPTTFVRGNVDLETTRAFADRLQRHRTISIALPGGDEFHPPGVVAYRLDGLGPQLAALDAEFRARREGVGFVSRIFRASP
ncbi:MAG: hypothetical protein SGI99_13060 [Pseudomonadota bacterium]|nr:hypothetical protein [Pseudomonadota bacterium]